MKFNKASQHRPLVAALWIMEPKESNGYKSSDEIVKN